MTLCVACVMLDDCHVRAHQQLMSKAVPAPSILTNLLPESLLIIQQLNVYP